MRPGRTNPVSLGNGGGRRPNPGISSCSIRAADEQEELAKAVCGGLSADGYPMGDDDPPAPLASGIDRAIRLSTAAAVLAVAAIAAYVSYGHAYAVVRAHGETGITAVAARGSGRRAVAHPCRRAA